MIGVCTVCCLCEVVKKCEKWKVCRGCLMLDLKLALNEVLMEVHPGPEILQPC